MILAGIVLAEAITRDGRYNVVQTQSYGPEARGGASKAEVIISSEKIAYPKVISPDILLALNNEALARYLPDLQDGGTLIIDEDVSGGNLPAKTFSLPILRTAREEIGREIVANMIAFGALIELIGLLDRERCLVAIKERVPAGTVEINQKAFLLGCQMMQEVNK